VSAWYRSPVELGWAKNIKFDHDFIGRAALEAEVANPRRVMRTLVWDADDVVDVYASLFRQGKPYHYMDIPRDQRGFMYSVTVVWGEPGEPQKEIGAKVAPAPYKKDNRRSDVGPV
jgi:vanillate/3-O-methylgallate O-demethylase